MRKIVISTFLVLSTGLMASPAYANIVTGHAKTKAKAHANAMKKASEDCARNSMNHAGKNSGLTGNFPNKANVTYTERKGRWKARYEYKCVPKGSLY